MSVNFMVHQVSGSDKRPHQCYGNDQPVKSPQHVAVGDMPGIDPDSDNDAYCPSVAGESAFPYLEYFGRMCHIIITGVEQAMSQTRAHYRGNDYIYEQFIEPSVGYLFVFKHFFDDLITCEKSYCEK